MSAGHWLAYAVLMLLVFTARAGRRIMVPVDNRHSRRAGELGLAPVEPDNSDVDPDAAANTEALDIDLVSWFALLGPRDDGDGAGYDGGDDGDGGD